MLFRSCITFTHEGEEADLRARLKAPAPNAEQPLYVSAPLKTHHVMVKDEDVCLHCGLCAERCPTGAWDMQKLSFHVALAGSTAQKACAVQAAAAPRPKPATAGAGAELAVHAPRKGEA